MVHCEKLECISEAFVCGQVAEALNGNRLAPPKLPQALLHALLQAPALLAALRSIIAGAAATKPAGMLALRCSLLGVGTVHAILLWLRL